MWNFFQERRGKQNLSGIQNGLVKLFLDQNRHYLFTYTYQSANVFIYRFIHFQIHLYIYSFIKSFVHVRKLSTLGTKMHWISVLTFFDLTAYLRIRKRNLKIKSSDFIEQGLYRIATSKYEYVGFFLFKTIVRKCYCSRLLQPKRLIPLNKK